MYGIYICMIKKILIDLLIVETSKTSKSSYSLLNGYIFYKKFLDLNKNMQLSISVQSICATNYLQWI